MTNRAKILLSIGLLVITVAYIAVPHAAQSAAPRYETLQQQVAHLPMCYSPTGCVGVPASDASAGYVTVTPNRWYEITVIGDGSGGLAGCWSTSAIETPDDAGPGACYLRQVLKDGQVKPIAFPGSYFCQSDAGCAPTPGDDAGGLTCQTDVGCVYEQRLYFYAVTTAGMGVTLCPETACK